MIETIDGATPAAAPCPSWCIDGADRGSEHHGEVWGTVATGGLPPIVDNIEAPTYNTVCVQPQHDEANGLPPHVALFGSWNGDNWQADLTGAQAPANPPAPGAPGAAAGGARRGRAAGGE